MNRFITYVLLLVGSTACVSALESGKGACNIGGEVCIELQVEEPITFGDAVPVTISLTTEKSISELEVSLTSYPPVIIEDAEGWKERGVNWVVNTEANQTIVFTRKVQFPPLEGVLHLTAGAYSPVLPYVTYSVRINFTKEGGKVYLPGTSIPINKGPLPTLNEIELATAAAISTLTAYPTSTVASATQAPPPEVLGSPAYPPLGTPYP